MAFKNLEQRFNEKVDELYRGATLKFDGGKPSTGANDDPLITRRPGDGYFGIADRFGGRSTPVSSTIQDVKRLTLFTVSTRGIAFLAKQQLLQTGNTFAQTRLLNPLFVVGNAVPFLHIRRNLRPITGKFGITASRDSIRSNARLLGQLQPATFDTVLAKYNLSKNNGSPSIRDRLKSGLRSLVQPFTDTISAFTAPRDVGEKYGRTSPNDGNGWDKSRPEIGSITVETVVQRANFQVETDRYFEEFSGGISGQRRSLPSNLVPKGLLVSSPNTQPFLKYFTSDPESISTRLADEMNARDRAVDARVNRRKISYIRDPLNTLTRDISDTLSRYQRLPSAGEDGNESVSDGTGNKIDPVLISFAMGNDSHVQFRAFIRDLTQSANPEYKTYQYIGRIEKFISYVTVQREVNFKLDILAFSKEELPIVWKRINYLTGLVFPYGVNRGILQPNIVRFTIGKVFMDQPAYVTSFSTNFNEISESWDIDQEVPIAATINLGMNIIEKNTMTANKPFYQIEEEQKISEAIVGQVQPISE